jgi:hypothetical protein
MNHDGAHSCVKGTSTCGGLICDRNGQIIKGFFDKVSSNSSLFAGIWALHSGMILA